MLETEDMGAKLLESELIFRREAGAVYAMKSATMKTSNLDKATVKTIVRPSSTSSRRHMTGEGQGYGKNKVSTCPAQQCGMCSIPD